MGSVVCELIVSIADKTVKRILDYESVWEKNCVCMGNVYHKTTSLVDDCIPWHNCKAHTILQLLLIH